MRNGSLAADYIRRATFRLRAIDTLYEAESWPDVVRQSQEVVELTLKALLRAIGVDPPRMHDVSKTLWSERGRLPEELLPEARRLAAISRLLRRDRELSFYGAVDLLPSEFYTKADADRARLDARLVVRLVRPHVLGDSAEDA